MLVTRKMVFCTITTLGPQLPSLLKFIKRVSTGKLRDYRLKDFPFEKDLDKHGAVANAVKIQSIYFSSGC